MQWYGCHRVICSAAFEASLSTGPDSTYTRRQRHDVKEWLPPSDLFALVHKLFPSRREIVRAVSMAGWLTEWVWRLHVFTGFSCSALMSLSRLLLFWDQFTELEIVPLITKAGDEYGHAYILSDAAAASQCHIWEVAALSFYFPRDEPTCDWMSFEFPLRLGCNLFSCGPEYYIDSWNMWAAYVHKWDRLQIWARLRRAPISNNDIISRNKDGKATFSSQSNRSHLVNIFDNYMNLLVLTWNTWFYCKYHKTLLVLLKHAPQ